MKVKIKSNKKHLWYKIGEEYNVRDADAQDLRNCENMGGSVECELYYACLLDSMLGSVILKSDCEIITETITPIYVSWHAQTKGFKVGEEYKLEGLAKQLFSEGHIRAEKEFLTPNEYKTVYKLALTKIGELSDIDLNDFVSGKLLNKNEVYKLFKKFLDEHPLERGMQIMESELVKFLNDNLK